MQLFLYIPWFQWEFSEKNVQIGVNHTVPRNSCQQREQILEQMPRCKDACYMLACIHESGVHEIWKNHTGSSCPPWYMCELQHSLLYLSLPGYE